VEDKHDLRPARGEGLRALQTLSHTVKKLICASARRQAVEVVGITGLTTYDQNGTPEHGRQHHRRDFEANPIHAVVVRRWQERDYGPGGTTAFLTNASVQQPLHPFDAEFALLVGVKLKAVPPSIGTLQEVLSQYGLTAEDYSLYWNFRSEESG
jgi:hypothetical protein